MNVSSVKNLNGETFSAVQDADLTTVVQTNSAAWGAGSTPTYDYTDNNLISAIDTSGLYATSALESKRANILNKNGMIGAGAYFSDNSQYNHNVMILNPTSTPFGTTSGIYGPLQYAAGAVTTYGSSSENTQYFGGFLKGNEWYVSNATAGQALRGETHRSRGVHLSGVTTDGYSFDLGIHCVSGKNNTAGYNWKLERGCVSGKCTTGEWRYGVAEDTALRTVSALEYNAVDEISGIAGSAIAQYGAEKQWLVHDDTLCHLSNSAQYALGVNLSAVAQLLGLDRTLLWSGSKGSVSDTMDLSEPLSSFNKVEFIMNEGNTAIPMHSFIGNTDGTILYPYCIRTNSNNAELCYLWSLNRQNNDTRLSVAISVTRTNGGTSGANSTKFNEIWGIGRKA